MHFGRPFLCALVALLFCVYLGSCEGSPELRSPRARALVVRQATTTIRAEDGPSSTRSSASQSTAKTSSGSASITSTSVSTSISVAPAASVTDIFQDERGDESPKEVYTGGLPIPPKITPGLGVTGIFLMVAGLCCCLVGIKVKRVYIFLSSAYLVSLAVTVLIVYVMNPPVGNAIQGAYVVAVVITGAALGGLAVVFPEVTEGLGCLLGGFCLSMWFLVLKPGGLVTSVYGKLIMIGVFCLVVFSLAFHRVTRPWGLIGSLSFAGATSLILGIDCYSRAGLKEFWLYIWALNDRLFPLGTDTYPHTRGMKVEIAAIIVVFSVGVMSQMKLWKILQERREVKDAARRIQEADLEAVDAETGRRVEAEYQEERGKWEAIYGDKDKNDASVVVRPTTGASKTDSGLGDDEIRASGEVVEGFVETKDMRQTREWRIQTVDEESSRRQSEAREDSDAISTLAGDQGLKPLHKNTQNSRRNSSEAASRRQSSQSLRRQSTQSGKGEDDQDFPEKPAGPMVIPLPFPIQHEAEDDNRSEGSSIAARADSDHFSVIEEQDGLDMPVFSFDRTSRASSLAATCDGRLDEEDDGLPELGRNSTVLDPKDIALPLSPRVSMLEDTAEGPFADGARTSIDSTPTSPKGPVDAVSNATPNSLSTAPKTPASVLPQDLVPASFPKSKAESTTSRGTFEIQTQCSKVVKTYRTNEWAKHLGEADKPELDDLSALQAADGDDEQPARLDFHELQGASKPISRKEARRSTSTPSPLPSPTSAAPPTRSSFRSNSIPLPIPEIATTEQSPSPPPITSEQVAHALSPVPLIERATSVAVQREDRFPKQGTLLGQRETLVRNRASIITALDTYSGPSPPGGPLPVGRSGAASAMSFTHARVPTPQSRVATPNSRVATPQSRVATPQGHQVLSDDMPLADRQQLLQLQTRRSWNTSQRHATTPLPGQHHEKRTEALHLSEGLQMQETTAAAHLADHRRAEMLDERKHAAMLERQKLVQGNLRGGLMEERMRQKDMLELHQEALMKMQRQANKHAL